MRIFVAAILILVGFYVIVVKGLPTGGYHHEQQIGEQA